MPSIEQTFRQSEPKIIGHVYSNGGSDPSTFNTMWSKANAQQKAAMQDAYTRLGAWSVDQAGNPTIDFNKVKNLGTELYKASQALKQGKPFRLNASITADMIGAMETLADNAKTAMASVPAVNGGQQAQLPTTNGGTAPGLTPGAAPPTTPSLASGVNLTPLGRTAIQQNEAANARAIELLKQTQTQLVTETNTLIATRPSVAPLLRPLVEKVLNLIEEYSNTPAGQARTQKKEELDRALKAVRETSDVDAEWKSSFFNVIRLSLENSRKQVEQAKTGFNNSAAIIEADLKLQEMLTLFPARMDVARTQLDAKGARAESQEAQSDLRTRKAENLTAIENDPEHQRLMVENANLKLEAENARLRQTQQTADLRGKQSASRTVEDMITAEARRISRQVADENRPLYKEMSTTSRDLRTAKSYERRLESKAPKMEEGNPLGNIGRILMGRRQESRARHEREDLELEVKSLQNQARTPLQLAQEQYRHQFNTEPPQTTDYTVLVRAYVTDRAQKRGLITA